MEETREPVTFARNLIFSKNSTLKHMHLKIFKYIRFLYYDMTNDLKIKN